jgi:epoxyqueuosine reductase
LNNPNTADLARIGTALRERARQLGFQRLGVTGIEIDRDRAYLERWLQLGRHGDMAYMARHGSKRSAPGELVPGTCRVICVRMDYLPEAQADARAMLERPDRAYIARYALGRDYHKLMRRRLQQLADWLRDRVVELHDRVAELHDEGAATHDRAPAMRFRVFVDSAPVLERALARNAGLGWIGKHTNLLDRQAGSWFLLGEIYTDLPLPCDSPVSEHCGSCRACIDVCPTQAIVAPYELDARRCISYLTIEQTGPIPVEFRAAIGNRIFGCDDCQLVCPWNRYARRTEEEAFLPRHGLDNRQLTELFGWSEREWAENTAGSAVRRPGFEGWRRNLAVALGNAPASAEVSAALAAAADDPSPLVREHVAWARDRHAARQR